MYDSLYSSAHPFMLKIKEPPTLTSGDVSIGQGDERQLQQPGEMLRWQVGQESEVCALFGDFC